MKSYTDIEQSKKLTEILPKDSADMVYFGIHQGMDGKYYLSGTNTEDDVVPTYKNLCIKVFEKTTASDVIIQLPCWSLAALLNIIPQEIFDGEYIINITEGWDTKWILTYDHHENRNHSYYGLSTDADNLVDACVDLLTKLKERNII